MSTRIDGGNSSGSSPFAGAWARFRGPLGAVRRRLASRSQASSRLWFLGGSALALAAFALLYYGSTASVGDSGRFLLSGLEFSADELIMVDHALRTNHIPFRIYDGRVTVDKEKLTEGDELISKLGIGPRAIFEIRQKALESQPFDLPSAYQNRQANAREELLAAKIRPLPGIVAADVTIHRPKVRGSLLNRPSSKANVGVGHRADPGLGNAPSVFVYLFTVGDRGISSKTVQSIQNLVVSSEPDVKRDAVTVMDRQGNSYLDASNPALSTLSRNKVREEEIHAEILEELADIKGVQVSVRIGISPLIPPPAKLPPLPKAGGSAASFSSAGSSADANDTQIVADHPKVGVNQPIELESATLPPPAPAASTPLPEARSSIATADPASADPGSANADPQPSRADIWVKVPRSYYLNVAKNRDPSEQERQSLRSRTELLIHTALKHVLPGDQLGDVDITIIPDDDIAATPGPSPASTEVRQVPAWAIPSGIAATLAAAATAIGFRLAASRRPLPSTSNRRGGRHDDRGHDRNPDRDRRRYEIGEAPETGPGPGPSARVRDLIRANPEAAASVLQRWTGQGGTAG